MLEEAAAWEAEAGKGGGGGGCGPLSSLSSVPPPKAWQWLSVVLWTCECGVGGVEEGVAGWVVEEEVGVVNE
jgi:hypothetical protein